MKTETQPNMAILREQLPHLYEQIKEISANEQEVRVKKAKNTDALILEKRKAGRWISLYSKFNPLEESKMWVDSVDGTPKHIVMFGFGLGYHFEALVDRFPRARFHIVEPDLQLFLRYIEEKGVSPRLFSKVEDFILSDRPEDYRAFCQAIIHFIDESWAFLSLPKFERAYSETFETYTKAFVKSKDDYTEQLLSLHTFEKIWNFNALKNLSQVYQSPNIFDYKDQFEGKTVILTASGPSLNDAIPFIRRIQQNKKAIVVAAGTSINGLINKGVRPDLFVSYDPYIANYKALQNVLDAGIPFVFGSTIYPGIPAEYKGPKAHMVTSPDKLAGFLNPALNPKHVIQDGPTITAVTLDLLNKLGVATVYLVGQDLCFINGKTGAEGVYVNNKEGHVDEAHLKNKECVENNNGELASTNLSFLKMKAFIENLIEKMDNKMSMYSSSLHGAKIQGMPYCSMEEAEAKLAANPIVEVNLLWEESDCENEWEGAVNKINEEIVFFSEVKEALERQLQRFRSSTALQKTKWQVKIDKSLDRLTHRTGYQTVIYPLVMNRINYLVRLKSNAEFSDMEQVDRYFEKGVLPLIEELTIVLNEYQSILCDYDAGQVK